MKRIRRIVLLLLPLLCLCSVTVTAAGVPYRTYTISADYEELASPAAYLPAGHIDSASLQLETPPGQHVVWTALLTSTEVPNISGVCRLC